MFRRRPLKTSRPKTLSLVGCDWSFLVHTRGVFSLSTSIGGTHANRKASCINSMNTFDAIYSTLGAVKKRAGKILQRHKQHNAGCRAPLRRGIDGRDPMPVLTRGLLLEAILRVGGGRTASKKENSNSRSLGSSNATNGSSSNERG